MKKLLLVCLAMLCYLAVAGSAAAHPLGNFTINHFSHVQVAGERVYVLYVLDLAEIPTFQDGRRGIGAVDYTARVIRGVELRVDGRRAKLATVARRLTQPAGTGGLRTTRFELILRGPRVAGPVRIDYRDRTYSGRIGWREIVIGDAPSRSHELREYPRDLLSSPLATTSVSATLDPNGDEQPKLGAPPARVEATGFAAVVDDDLSLTVVLASLALALFWGAAHALSPGHGKAIVAAYLVGTRGTARHAALLGLVVTVTHTVGVFTLGLVTLALSQFVVPEDLYPWLNLASALLVVAVGVTVLRARSAHARAHRHRHDHHHHHHEYEGGLRGLVATGVSGGILPCPTALVVLLAAISLHRVGYGLLLIVAFSLGLAATVTGIGIVATTARRFFARTSFEGRIVRLLPTASALVVLLLGIAMTLRALPGVS
jgi:nickel/cobalt transporter (NicO) family protein